MTFTFLKIYTFIFIYVILDNGESVIDIREEVCIIMRHTVSLIDVFVLLLRR